MKIPTIAIFDIGKTNKKLFLFNENYEIVLEKSTQFSEITDDGKPIEQPRLLCVDMLPDERAVRIRIRPPRKRRGAGRDLPAPLELATEIGSSRSGARGRPRVLPRGQRLRPRLAGR